MQYCPYLVSFTVLTAYDTLWMKIYVLSIKSSNRDLRNLTAGNGLMVQAISVKVVVFYSVYSAKTPDIIIEKDVCVR